MKKTLMLICLWLSYALAPLTWAADEQQLVLTGSSTLAPLVLEIGKRFEQTHQGVRVDVQTGGLPEG